MLHIFLEINTTLKNIYIYLSATSFDELWKRRRWWRRKQKKKRFSSTSNNIRKKRNDELK